MARYLPIALAAGLGSAVLYAAALSGHFLGVVLAYLAVLPLFVVGLTRGPAATAIAAVCAAAGIVAFGSWLLGLMFAVTQAIPAVAMTVLALRNRQWTDGQTYWYPAGRLLAGLSLWCAGLIVVAAIALAVSGDGLVAGVETVLHAMTAAFGQEANLPVDASALKSAAMILPGVVAWSWMLMMTVNGLLAQVIARRLGKILRPPLRLADVDIGYTWIGFGAVCVLVGLVVPGDFGFGAINVAIVLAYPLFFQGLGVVHGLVHYWGGGPLAFGLFYFLLILLGWLALVVIVLGLAEPFVRLRTRFAGRKNT